MKLFLAIFITAVVTWTTASVIHAVRTATERFWMISAIKAPGRMALEDIQSDMKAGRYDMAKRKTDAFVTTWQRFESGPDSFSGYGIGDVMVTFSKIPDGEEGGATNRSQPVQPATNSTPSPAGSGR
jgi:hypothetical protein